MSDQHMVWLDLEMTGLELESNRIIEIAVLVTDANLEVVAEGPNIAIYQDQAFLDQMDDWNQTTHKETGLISRVQQSSVSNAQAEQKVLDFLKSLNIKPKTLPLCGNSIWQDRRFLAAYMPELAAFFHYRNIDVSTIKELAKRWYPALYAGFSKKGSHRALDDVYESIAELKYYRQAIAG